MKQNRRFIWISLVLVALLLAAPLPAAARATKTGVEVIDYGCELVEPGVSWIDEEGVLHIKGQVYEGETQSDDPRFVGYSALHVISWNIDLSTGNYTLHATGTLDPSAPDIEGLWQFPSINTRSVGGDIAARAVAHGDGDLDGLKVSMIIETLDVNYGQGAEVCGRTPEYVSRWNLTLLDPHGE